MLRSLLQEATVAGEKRKIVSVGPVRAEQKHALVPPKTRKRYYDNSDHNEEEEESKMRLKQKKLERHGLNSMGVPDERDNEL